ncbi:MAG: heavy-metal-associated domain-containing protein [Bdellovibrionales bacterium]
MRIGKLILSSTLLITPGLALAKPITVQVKGMVCAFCAQGIEKKFKALSEVSSVKVSLASKKVELETKEGKDVTDDQIKKIVKKSGYDVVKIERTK